VLPKATVKALSTRGELLGFVSCRPGWIEHLYVAPKYWRRGLGTQLMRAVQKPESSIQLWTFQRNKVARSVYTAMGFQEAELTDGSGNEEREPDVRMAWLPRI
jgi:putative acetyltransferase